MLLCIAGKNNIAVDILKVALKRYSNRFEIGIVCNQTESGTNDWQKSFRFFAQKWGVKEYKLEELYDIRDLVFLSLEFDKIVVPSRFQSSYLYNIHFSLLPQYKGMYTSAMPILNDEIETGVTLHRIDAGIDTGDIIAQKRFSILKEDTGKDLYQKYIENGTLLVREWLDTLILEPNRISAYPQSAEGSSYYSKTAICYSPLVLDLNQTALKIYNQVRAFNFRRYQIPEIFGFPITKAIILKQKSVKKPGTLCEDMEWGLRVSTVDYDILLIKDRFEDLLTACEEGDVFVVQQILARDSNLIKEKNDRGHTPLMVAVYNNQIQVACQLIALGADVFAVNHNGTNLLMYAKEAFLRYKDRYLFDLLLNMGLSPDKKDYQDHDLWYYLKENGCLDLIQ